MVQELLEVGLLKVRVRGSVGWRAQRSAGAPGGAGWGARGPALTPGLQAAQLQGQHQGQGPRRGRLGRGAHVHFARRLRVRWAGSRDRRTPSRDGLGGAVSSSAVSRRRPASGSSSFWRSCVTTKMVAVGAQEVGRGLEGPVLGRGRAWPVTRPLAATAEGRAPCHTRTGRKCLPRCPAASRPHGVVLGRAPVKSRAGEVRLLSSCSERALRGREGALGGWGWGLRRGGSAAVEEEPVLSEQQ